MAEPIEDWEDVDDWEDAALLPQDFGDAASTARTPGPESVSPEPYGPAPDPVRADLRPSVAGNIRDAAEVMGIPIPTEEEARGAVASFIQGPAFQWADELAGLQAKQHAAVGNIGTPMAEQADLEQAYLDGRNAFRGAETAFRADNPGRALALTVAGGLGAPSPGAFAPALSTRVAGAAASGALAGAGSSEEAEDAPHGAALGAPLGAAGQLLGEGAGAGVGWAARLLGRGVQGLVRPTDAARRLQEKGVDLTIGQMAPRSALAQVEEAGTSTAGIGPAIKSQRDAALQGVQQAALREALPPGLSAVPGGSLGEQVGAISRAFRGAYGAAKGHDVSPDAVRRALDAVDDPRLYADDALRAKVAKWLTNQMTALRLRGPSGGVISDDVIALRSNLRDLSRDAATPEERSLLRAAEEQVTAALDAALPQEVRAALKATDQQYAKFRTVAEAVGRAVDQADGFTTKQLSAAVKANTPERMYEQGGGGPLRVLARDAEETLGAKIPLTGARLLSAGPVPYLVGPMAYASNLPGPKRLLTGTTEFQRSLQSSAALRSLAAMSPGAISPVGGAVGAAVGRGSMPQGSFVESVATTNPEALGPYAEVLQRAAAEGNTALVHWQLQQTDPQYRALIEALRKEQPQ